MVIINNCPFHFLNSEINKKNIKSLDLLSYAIVIAFMLLFLNKILASTMPSNLERIEPLMKQDELPSEILADLLAIPGNELPYINETTIQPKDTLSNILSRLELNELGLMKFLSCDVNAANIHKLYPGRLIQSATNPSGKFLWLRYIHTLSNQINGQVVAKQLYVVPFGKTYKAFEKIQHADRQTRYSMGTTYSSLFNATDSVGIPDAITMQMAEILRTKIDFLKDLRKGDQFRVIYEVYYHEGRYISAGRVLALEFTNNNKIYNAVWFSPDGKNGAYYDFDGICLQGNFLRTALKFTRISSTFGKRLHPIHKTWSEHKGVDYAAPSGTPIYATADGIVEFSGWKNGYGNVVILNHLDEYSTLYAHQSKIEPGIVRNAKVLQGQLLGYVGATGNATGPHLHYELRIRNFPVDPLSIAFPRTQKLESSQLKVFKKSVISYQEKMDLLREFQKA